MENQIITSETGELLVSKGLAIWENNDPWDIAYQVAMLTKGGMTPLALEAWTSLISGVVPPEAIKEREGYPNKIKYVSHVTSTEYMNNAWGHLWDYEVLHAWINEDKSASAVVAMSVYIPVGRDENGSIILHRRIVAEVGAFEAYVRYEYVDKHDPETGEVMLNAKGNPLKDRIPARDPDGNLLYTMAAADREASAVSRAIPRCMYRMFGWGSNLYEEPTEISEKSAWNNILNFGTTKRGLTKEQVVQMVNVELGLKASDLLDEEKYMKAYKYLYELRMDEVPNQMK